MHNCGFLRLILARYQRQASLALHVPAHRQLVVHDVQVLIALRFAFSSASGQLSELLRDAMQFFARQTAANLLQQCILDEWKIHAIMHDGKE